MTETHPETVETVHLAARIPTTLRDQIDRYAAELTSAVRVTQVCRSAAVRKLLEMGLAVAASSQRRTP